MLRAGKGFLQAHGAAIAAAITPLMSDPLPEGLKALCAMCDTVMVAFGAAGCRLLQAPLAAALGDVLEQGHGGQQGFGHRLGLLLRCAVAAQQRLTTAHARAAGWWWWTPTCFAPWPTAAPPRASAMRSTAL